MEHVHTFRFPRFAKDAATQPKKPDLDSNKRFYINIRTELKNTHLTLEEIANVKGRLIAIRNFFIKLLDRLEESPTTIVSYDQLYMISRNALPDYTDVEVAVISDILFELAQLHNPKLDFLSSVDNFMAYLIDVKDDIAALEKFNV